MKAHRLAYLVGVIGFAITAAATAATLQPLVNQPPANVGPNPPFLLTDGSVMFQDDSFTGFWKLTPDAFGSYLNGTWTELASLPSAWSYGPYAYASAVLADGRVLIEGGEYNLGGPFSLTNKGAIYDPVADSWTQVDPPPGWNNIGDSASIVMPNGKFVLGDKLSMRMAELDPATMTWTALGSDGKADFNAEEGWTLLPDGSFMTVDVFDAPNSERYVYTDAAGAGQWSSLGPTPQSLAWDYGKPPIIFPGGTYTPPGETGQCILMSIGVFCTGASDDQPIHIAHTALLDIGSMTWSAGPDFPAGDDAGDTSAVLMPNGSVLVSAESGQLYEYGFDNMLTPTLDPGAEALLLTLPSGEVLVNSSFDVEIYTPDDTDPDPLAMPTVIDLAPTLIAGTTYEVAGFQFNGISQAQAFGDENQAPTNYPLVRITNIASGHVFYARTHDHSTMGVATGATTTVTTHFDVPIDIEQGPSRVAVVANGVASNEECHRVVAADTIFFDSFDFCSI